MSGWQVVVRRDFTYAPTVDLDAPPYDVAVTISVNAPDGAETMSVLQAIMDTVAEIGRDVVKRWPPQ